MILHVSPPTHHNFTTNYRTQTPQKLKIPQQKQHSTTPNFSRIEATKNAYSSFK
jgi:hypothetical protein